MKALIYLEHDVAAFSINNRQFNSLKQRCPEIDFVKVHTHAEVDNHLCDSDIFITWQFIAPWYALGRRLKAIFTPAAGNDWIERDDKYFLSINNGTFHGRIMTESLLGMIFFFNRRFNQLIQNKTDKIYNRNIESSTSILRNQHVLIIGYGNIGKVIARTLNFFNCKITGVKQTISCEKEIYADQLITPDQLLAFLGSADHIVTILPKDNSTDNLLTLNHFKAMKRSSIFYNIGRGNCYKESDIVDALKKRYIAGAGLDVFETEPLPRESKLWDLPQVLILPHASAICKEYLDLYIDELAPKIMAFKN